MPRALCHQFQHQEHPCAGVTINCVASILLHGQVPAARCPLDDQDGVPGPPHSPGVAEAGSAWAAFVQRCATQSSAQFHPPFHPGGWLPSRAAAKLCLARPRLCPPSLPPKAAACSCAWPGGGSLTALVPSKAGRVLLGTVLCSAPARES